MVTVRFLGHRPPYEAGDCAEMDEAEAEGLERKGLVELVDDMPPAQGWAALTETEPRK